MPQEVEHDGNFSQDQLQTNLRFNEAAWGKITAIAVRGDLTVSTHDDITTVPDDSLELKLDPNGTEAGPSGSALLCRGEAKIEGSTKKVATFRKGSAASTATGASAPSASSDEPTTGAPDTLPSTPGAGAAGSSDEPTGGAAGG